MKERLKEFGSNSLNKCIPDQIFSCDVELLEILNDAYRIGNAWKPKENRKSHPYCELIHNTSSDQLAKDLKVLYMLFGLPLAPHCQKDHQGAGNNSIWRLYESSDKVYRDKMPGVTNKGLRYRKYIGDQEVCDITVADTHNFVLSNGIVAHNCDEYAVLAAATMSHPAFLMSVQWYDPSKKLFKRFKGHNVALYFKDNKFYHISNTGRYGPFNRFYDAVYSVVPSGCIPCAFQCRTVKKFGKKEPDLHWVSGGKLNAENAKKFK